MKKDFYKQLTKEENQLCDLCKDWNLGDCEDCEFVSRFNLNKTQEVKFIDNSRKMAWRRKYFGD